jgi:hypothetical protein
VTAIDRTLELASQVRQELGEVERVLDSLDGDAVEALNWQLEATLNVLAVALEPLRQPQ